MPTSLQILFFEKPWDEQNRLNQKGEFSMRLQTAKLPVRITTAGLSLLLGSIVSTTSYGQLPSQSKSAPLNYFARFHGLGYSDGYHACPNNQCAPSRSWSGASGFSSFYREPTSPPASRFQKPAPSYSVYQSSGQPVDMNIYPSTDHPGDPSGAAYPASPHHRGTSSGEMLQPPQPLRTPNQTRRSIHGTTQPYQANSPSPTIGR
ncbi:MAG: hypothetical protein ACK5YR_06985 [Pirellula sp.]|jgi:hypothetical protein